MPDQGGLQLLPETRKKIEIITPGENRLLTSGSIVLALVAVLSIGLYFYKASLEEDLASLDADIAATEQQRNKQSEQNIIIFNKQVSTLANLLDKHTHWTVAFAKIEELAQVQIQLDSLTASLADNKVDFKATAANYTTIARQIAAFASDDSITDVILNKVNTLTNGRLEFTMQVVFDKNKFLFKQRP